MNPARRYTTMAAAAGILTALLALPAGTQNYPADLDPAGCSNGNYVYRPTATEAANCRTLVSIRNHWTRQGQPPPPHSLILNWGTGLIDDWHGINQQKAGTGE